VGVDHVGRKTPADLPDRGALRSERAGRLDDPNNRNTGGIQFINEKWFGDTTLQEHDHTNIDSRFLLSCSECANDALEAAESSRGEKMQDFQNPASRRRNPFRESPAGMLSLGSAYNDGDDFGIQLPSIRNAPAYPALRAAA
jgi:hypothetical protein